MARVPYVARDDLPIGQQEIFDGIASARGGKVPRVFSAFLNAPEFARRIGEVGAYARFHSQLPNDVREILILATAQKHGCQYEFTHHFPLAQQAGVRDVVLEGLKNGTTRGMLPKESVWVDYAKQVIANRVKDATFVAVEHLVGRHIAVEATMVVGYYSMLAHTMLALDVALEEGLEPLLPEA